MKPLIYTHRGFTLVELLVAVGIIGVLASVSMVSVNSIREKARDARRLTDIKEVQNGLEAYYSTTGNYPAAQATANAGLGTANFTQLCDTALGFDTQANCQGRTIFMATVNENPPPDGKAFKYTPASCQNGANCQNYTITFELMSATGSFSAGCYSGTPDGIARVGDNGNAACS